MSDDCIWGKSSACKTVSGACAASRANEPVVLFVMAMTPKLELRQSQGLVMTPQLQQAIKLLQMSHAELQSFVEAELERNPLLEREDSGGDSEAASRTTADEEPQGGPETVDADAVPKPVAQGQSDS